MRHPGPPIKGPASAHGATLFPLCPIDSACLWKAECESPVLCKGPYPLEQHTVARRLSADFRRLISVG